VSNPSVTVIDYGIGNIFSVRRALEYCGADVQLSSKQTEIAAADRVILPGVGAFATGRPILGICLGMQMLATSSEEFGENAGLGLIPGRVTKVPDKSIEGKPNKIPHIGWKEIFPASGGDWKATILEDTPEGTPVYLVHSFHLVPYDPADLLADCNYGGHRVTAAVRSGNIFGAQFHPEKSGKAGLQMLAAFLRL
jgi:imidazole glycerol-phosphate synthase subunit HisH